MIHSAVLLSSKGWLDWRDGSLEEIEQMLNWPFAGICFDIENSDFWIESWGAKPSSLEERFEIARLAVNAAPKLIPILGHRYIPEKPHEAGNPVFSVHQTDIIYYGSDLEEFFKNEFLNAFDRASYSIEMPVKNIPFWSEMQEQNWIK